MTEEEKKIANLKATQSRKWFVTINNPIDHGFPHDIIRDKLSSIRGKGLYWCMCDEIGGHCETLHTHIYIYRPSALRAYDIYKLFGDSHRDKKPYIRSEDARAYILKDGEKFNKAEDGSYEYIDDKGILHKGINYSDTFEEFGELPIEHQGVSTSAELILEFIKCGATNDEIVNEIPSAYTKLEDIDNVRSLLRDKKYKNAWRDLTVTYIFGVPGVGKSRSIIERHGYGNVYRVTNYKNYPFDTYDGEDVIVFEDYRSNLNITDMLNYLDGYPLKLPARYHNKQACFTKVYITSNLPLEEQHKKEDKDTKKALYRRIHKVVEYTETSRKEYDGVQDYFDDNRCY